MIRQSRSQNKTLFMVLIHEVGVIEFKINVQEYSSYLYIYTYSVVEINVCCEM